MSSQRYELFPISEKAKCILIWRDAKRNEMHRLETVELNSEDDFKEINTLKRLRHPNIRQLLRFTQARQLEVILEYEHSEWNLYDYLSYQYLTLRETRFVFKQIMNGLKYLHDNSIVHRNLQPRIISITDNGIVKIAKFGYVEENLFEGLNSSIVSYRAPEVLLGDIFREPVDLWSAGCILVELFRRRPLFTGSCVSHQLEQIYEAVGTPVNYYFAHNFPMKHTFKLWKGPPLNLQCPDAEHLALQLLKFDGTKRLDICRIVNLRVVHLNELFIIHTENSFKKCGIEQIPVIFFATICAATLCLFLETAFCLTDSSLNSIPLLIKQLNDPFNSRTTKYLSNIYTRI